MRKLWNRPAIPVWSVSTKDAAGYGNMNISTYVSAVALDPKLMMVAVYHGTKTLQNIVKDKHCLLQLLTEDLAPVVRVCGKESGQDIDKIKRLQKRYPLKQHNDLWYFADAAGWLELLIVDQYTPKNSDHVLMIGEVIKRKNLSDSEILSTSHLREKKIIR